LWILDPDAGDRIGVVPALGPTKGLATERRLIDLTLLSTAQGLALTPTGPDLRVSVQGDLVRVTRPGGLTLSAPSAELERARLPEGPRAASMPALILTDWGDAGEAGFSARYRQLQALAAEEAYSSGNPPIQARLSL